MTTAPDSLTANRIADFAEVRIAHHTVVLELTPAPIAWLLDMPGYVSCMVYEFPVDETPEDAYRAWCRTTGEDGPRIAVVQCDEPLVLPMLTRDAAEEVAMHSHFSGAPLMITTQVCAQRGMDAMYDYADTQSMYGMPGAPKIEEDKLKWIGSGL